MANAAIMALHIRLKDCRVYAISLVVMVLSWLASRPYVPTRHFPLRSTLLCLGFVAAATDLAWTLTYFHALPMLAAGFARNLGGIGAILVWTTATTLLYAWRFRPPAALAVGWTVAVAAFWWHYHFVPDPLAQGFFLGMTALAGIVACVLGIRWVLRGAPIPRAHAARALNVVGAVLFTSGWGLLVRHDPPGMAFAGVAVMTLLALLIGSRAMVGATAFTVLTIACLARPTGAAIVAVAALILTAVTLPPVWARARTAALAVLPPALRRRLPATSLSASQ